MADAPNPAIWILPGRAYPGWYWVVAAAGLWVLFALLLLVIGELQREHESGAVSRVTLGYYLTAGAALFVALCAFVRRKWARQLALIANVPMLMFLPVGTLLAGMALRALIRGRGFFDASYS